MVTQGEPPKQDCLTCVSNSRSGFPSELSTLDESLPPLFRAMYKLLPILAGSVGLCSPFPFYFSSSLPLT